MLYISCKRKQSGLHCSEKYKRYVDRNIEVRGHIVTKTCRLKREFLAQRKPSAGPQNARKIRCRTHFLDESLYTYSISMVSGSIIPEYRDDGEAIGKQGQSLP